jgi:hypothetical protein
LPAAATKNTRATEKHKSAGPRSAPPSPTRKGPAPRSTSVQGRLVVKRALSDSESTRRLPRRRTARRPPAGSGGRAQPQIGRCAFYIGTSRPRCTCAGGESV